MSDFPTMNTGDITRRIGLTITSGLLKECGFEPADTDKRAQLYKQSDYEAICDALAEHIRSKKNVPMQPRPEREPAKPKKDAAPTGDAKKAGKAAEQPVPAATSTVPADYADDL